MNVQVRGLWTEHAHVHVPTSCTIQCRCRCSVHRCRFTSLPYGFTLHPELLKSVSAPAQPPLRHAKQTLPGGASAALSSSSCDTLQQPRPPLQTCESASSRFVGQVARQEGPHHVRWAHPVRDACAMRGVASRPMLPQLLMLWTPAA